MDLLEERSEVNVTMCEASMIVRERDLVTLPKFAEGILVGGHILVMIFSGCGNVAALIIVAKSKAPKLSTKYFLIMLAISDLLMTTVAPPTEVAKIIRDFNEWIFGGVMCKVVPFTQLLSATMSALCLMTIAAERNFLIVGAMSSSTSTANRLWQKWIIPLMSVAIIFLPIGCALPQIWYYDHRKFLAVPRQFTTTTEASEGSVGTTISESTSTIAPPRCDIRYYCWRNDFDRRNIIYWSITGSTYILLLLCFLISYISIYKFVKKHGKFRKQLAQDYSSTSAGRSESESGTQSMHNALPHVRNKLAAAERHRKTLKLILGLILLQLCCRAPNWVYLVIINVKKVNTTKVTLTLLECFHLLSTVSCALNPFLYVIWNHSLRAPVEDRDGRSGSNKSCYGRCKKTRRFCQYIFCCCYCCCFKYELEDMNGQIFSDPVVQPTSSVWLWKTPTVYHISSGGVT